jgi:predicted AlkP superfamily phosphohydrolase/phosphomutase
MTKVFVIGLDCAAPELMFDRWRADLPNFTRLAERGLWGELASCIPAITVPAWSSMLTSKDPGVLGFYGFHNRADYSYDNQLIVTGSAVKEKRVWDYLGEAGLNSLVLGVPQTYPVRPLKGWQVSCFLTPSIESKFAYPAEFKAEVLSIAPDYDFDVARFRTDDKSWLLEQIHTMTDKHFALIDATLAAKPWDFFMSVEIGVDRIHHGFWKYHDPQHFRYEAGNPYEHAIHDYYVKIDRKLGEWLARLDPDTVVLVVSDHGAKRMDGGVCVNEWLWRNGYLVFREGPVPGRRVPLEKLEVDWMRTRAWGAGGYYGRIFLNVQGREPQGIIAANAYEKVRDELIQKFAGLADDQGRPIGARSFKPSEIYRQVKGPAPDLIVYFGDLLWRAVGALGYDGWITYDNDTGPDDCNHAQNGLFILNDPRRPQPSQQVHGAQLMDIAPTILSLFGLPVPSDMQGRILQNL